MGVRPLREWGEGFRDRCADSGGSLRCSMVGRGSLTGGGCPPAWLAARWLLDKGLLLWAALELTDTGASPSSAMRDRYSLSIRALSCAD